MMATESHACNGQNLKRVWKEVLSVSHQSSFKLTSSVLNCSRDDTMLFRILSPNKLIRNDRNVGSRCCCFLSPSGRYGVYISRTEVLNSQPNETHFYNYFFIVSDFILDTTTEYVSTCSPFKRFHRFYYLNDDVGVLVDFSRNNGNITQNVIQFSHIEHTVTCEYARLWSFHVDDMLYETDNTRMICTTALMKDGAISYLPLLGEKDNISMIFARLVPANPFHSCDFVIPTLEISEREAYQRGIRMDDGELLRESDLCTDTKCYPLINGTSLYFIVRLRTQHPETEGETCVAMLKVDFKNYFKNGFSSTAKIDTTVSLLRWESTPIEKYSIRPRFVRIMAQEENVALLRAFIFLPERTWILIDMNTMRMSALKCQRIAR
ncbi:unnamed protein product [Litomosoides sigmodontis]|uniref:Uncharacterized protein n=1 Tax=Litomosoides sigmodontis TaxID=42156 RepID=A0A3P6TQT4_LITSI|nr:unnamed protein product [Litomosoides sigmodontis]